MLPEPAVTAPDPRLHRWWTPVALQDGGALAWTAANLLAAGLYFTLGLVVDHFFAAYGLFPAPIWLPASIAVVAAMIGGLRLLPGIFLGSFIANHVLFAPPLYVTFIISVTNALGPIIGAVFLRRARLAGRLFTTFSGVTVFLICTTFVAPAISGAGGALAVALGKPFDLAQTYSVWVNWWLTDSGGTLYLAPALILWLGLEAEDDTAREDRASNRARDRAVWALVAVGSVILFLTPPLHVSYIRSLFPFLLVVPLSWIALRMSLRSAYTLVSLLAIVATAGAVAGVGPFQGNALANPLQLVGTLVVLLSMNVLTIVALVSERQEAQNARKLKAMFLARTSHELRTPLNAVIGFSSLIAQEALGPLANRKYVEYAQLIQSGGEHLLALINDLIDLSRIEAGHAELHEQPLPLTALIEEAARFVSEAARTKGIALRLDTGGADMTILADRKAMRQILINLLSNAVKFTPAGGRIELSAALNDGGEPVIRISDTGIGIPPEAMKRLFTPFERAPRAATERIEGTGLGLTITKGLVALHGGTVALSSKVGEGATVTVTLPASRVLTPPSPVAALRTARRASG